MTDVEDVVVITGVTVTCREVDGDAVNTNVIVTCRQVDDAVILDSDMLTSLVHDARDVWIIILMLMLTSFTCVNNSKTY